MVLSYLGNGFLGGRDQAKLADLSPEQTLMWLKLLTWLSHGDDSSHELCSLCSWGEDFLTRPGGVAQARQGMLLEAGMTHQQLGQLL